MTTAVRPLRPLLRVGLPVAIATVLVALAVINIALVKTSRSWFDDGVLWGQAGTRVVALEVAPSESGAQAGLQPRDVLLLVDGREVHSPADVVAALHSRPGGEVLTYIVQRGASQAPFAVQLQALPALDHGLYYSLALVGVLAILVGSSVRLRRPNDPATLHFYWLAVAFFGVLAFTPSGRYDRLDYFFEWADLVARLLLPPLFLHFALVFP
ncbi:MAG: PDZ domain-containing protein [Acidobacteriota bacterium]